MTMLSDLARRRLAAIERLAKDNSVPFHLIQEALVNFVIEFNYYRTPYRIYAPVVLRARSKHFKTDEEACEYFNDQDKLTYPDVKKINLDWGRCNGPNEAVFYCADENVIPIFEVRPQKDDYLVLGQYIHPSLEKINLLLPVIGVEQIVDSLRQRDPTHWLLNVLVNDMHYRKNVTPETIAIDRHFASWFTKAVDNSCRHYYKLTTALYQAFIKNCKIENGEKSYCGLMYPSVASDITGTNLALEPNFVDNHVKLFQAVIYKVKSVDLDAKRFDLQPIKILSAIHHNGKLEWKDFPFKDKWLQFDPSTPTKHSKPSEDYFRVMSVYK